MKKVVVVGGGLAGISAGIKLMEERPGTQVTLYNLGHHLGGKAHSYRDDLGFNIDHGYHTLNSKYDRMLAMMERAGIRLDRVLSPRIGGAFMYDPEVEGMLAGPGRPQPSEDVREQRAEDQKIQAEFSAKYGQLIVGEPDIEKYDDICWADFNIERGVPERITESLPFRFARDALFNWPHPISTYVLMKSTRLTVGGYGNLTTGTYNETIINPLVRYFKRLGGTIELYSKLVKVLHEGGHVTGLHFAQPDFHYHNHGEKVRWEREVRVLPDINEVTDFDHAIIAITVDSLRELNKGDAGFWRGFPGIENCSSVGTLTISTWTEKPIWESVAKDATTGPTYILRLNEPNPMVTDYKFIRDEYKYNKDFGSVLQSCGQDGNFEHLTDEEIIARFYDNLAECEGIRDPREAGIIHEHLNRNMSNHERYHLYDPGTLQFRPHSKTHIDNMFLAGDWIRNDVDCGTMESAVCSGFTAVEELLKVS